MIIPLLRFALISRQENTCAFYRDLMSGRENILFETYASVAELKKNCLEKHYAGLIIDMWTHIGSVQADKEFVYALDRIFPILYIGDQDRKPSPLDPAGGWLMARQHEVKILDDFIHNQCRGNKPRGIRSTARRELFFNAHVQFSGQEKSIKTNTWNISPSGCFIISSLEPRVGEPVWLTITDWADKTAIAGEIRWSRPWGDDFRSLPGVGISFKQITAAQNQALADLLK
jgi:hypothetical protein